MTTAQTEPLRGMAGLTQPSADILVVLGWLILAAVVIIVAAFIVHKKLRDADNQPVNRLAFTLSDLRRLKAEGQISDAEYERTKAALIARSRAEMDRAEAEDESLDKQHEVVTTELPPIDADSDNQNNSLDGRG